MIETGRTKLRYLLAAHGETILRLGVVLVLIGVLGSAATLAAPPTATVTDTSGQSVVEVQSSSTAVVEGDHELYRGGERLTDETVYIRRVTPNATVTSTVRAPAGTVVEQRLVLVYEASSGSGDVFREQRRPLASTTATVDGSEAADLSATLRVADVAATLDAMREEIGDAGSVNVYLSTETTYEHGEYTGTLADREPLAVTSDSFRVPALRASASYGPVTTTQRPIEAAVFQPTVPSVGSIVVPHTTGVFLLVVLVGLAAVGVALRSRGVFDPEREQAHVHHRRYAEWISTGHLPVALATWSNVVVLDSLEALVDVAIDSESRVIFDPSEGCYAVFAAGTTYTFLATELE